MTFRNILFVSIAALEIAAMSQALAAPYWTPATEACVKQAGYKKQDWQAKRVPAGPAADGIRACMARVRGKG